MTEHDATLRREADFHQIEAAVLETARGRWFLAEFARRRRNTDTETVMAALARLQAIIRGTGRQKPTASPVAAPPGVDIDGVRSDIGAALRLLAQSQGIIDGAGNDRKALASAIAWQREAADRLGAALARLPLKSAAERPAAPRPSPAPVPPATRPSPAAMPLVAAALAPTPAPPKALAKPAAPTLAPTPAPTIAKAEAIVPAPAAKAPAPNPEPARPVTEAVASPPSARAPETPLATLSSILDAAAEAVLSPPPAALPRILAVDPTPELEFLDQAEVAGSPTADIVSAIALADTKPVIVEAPAAASATPAPPPPVVAKAPFSAPVPLEDWAAEPGEIEKPPERVEPIQANPVIPPGLSIPQGLSDRLEAVLSRLIEPEIVAAASAQAAAPAAAAPIVPPVRAEVRPDRPAIQPAASVAPPVRAEARPERPAVPPVPAPTPRPSSIGLTPPPRPLAPRGPQPTLRATVPAQRPQPAAAPKPAEDPTATMSRAEKIALFC